MNWTGGHLLRRSRGGATASLNQRQKKHFATVQNLRNGTEKRSPINWSIFGKIQVQQADHGRQCSGEPREYRETSLPTPHGRPRDTGDSNKKNHSGHAIRYAQRTRQPTMKQEDSQNDDLYNATPPPVQKRRREGFPSANSVDDEEVDSISKKRQKLLERRDWVGITYQRPLKMAFVSPRHADNVGRRRKVTVGHQAQYDSRQSTLTSPFVARARKNSSQNLDTRSQGGKTDVRIHIGDRIIPPGISSSTSPTRRTRGHSTTRQIRRQSHVASSDVMLLDNNEYLRNIPSRGANMTSFDYEDDQASRNSPYPPIKNLEDERDSGDSQLGYDAQSGGGEDNGFFGDVYDFDQDYHNYSSKEADTSPNVPDRSPILGIPFSPSLIKHPIPQSSIVSSILRSGSSQIADSTVAQIGKFKPVVPSSQILDNEVWETWMAPLFNDEPCHDQPGEERSDVESESRISPGISTAPACQFRRPKSTMYQSAPKAEVEEFNEVERALRIVNPSVPGSSCTEDHVGRREPTRITFRSEPEGHSQMRRVEEPMSSLNTTRVGMSNLPATNIAAVLETPMGHFDCPPSELTRTRNYLHAQPETKGRNKAHPDDLWRKFVFGSEETVETDHIPKPSPFLQTMRQNDIGYSERGDPSTGAPANSPTYTERRNESTTQCSKSGPQAHTPSTVLKADTTSSDMPWDPPKGVASGTYLPTREDNTSLHSCKRTQDSFTSDPALDSDDSTLSGLSETGQPSIAVVASSQSRASNSWDTPPSSRPKKIVFKKPKRYERAKTAPQSSPTQEEPLHIGRVLMEGSKKKQARDIYNLMDSDEVLDE
jgi:hypothetical protein